LPASIESPDKPESTQNARVFVSYSRSDGAIVAPLVKLLRLRGDMVFFDMDSISPGQLWRDELETAIESAGWFVLFWCAHSSQSREVEREFRAALALGKKIVPLLLDDTAIPDRVAEFQGIDFRSIPGLHAACQAHEAPWLEPPIRPPAATAPAPLSPGPVPQPGAAAKEPAAARVATFDTRGGTVGRSESCTLCLPDPERSISRVQLEVAFANEGFTVRNLGAGSVVHGGRPVEVGATAALATGDSIELTSYRLTATVLPGPVPSLRLEAINASDPAPAWSAPPTARLPDDFDPFASPAGPATPARGAPSGPVDPFADLGPTPLHGDLDALFGGPPPPASGPSDDALVQAADRLLSVLRST
jgi:hypothetical protein